MNRRKIQQTLWPTQNACHYEHNGSSGEPIVDYFGHQLGEYGGRQLLSSLDQRNGQLLFLHPCEDLYFRQLLNWQKAWIRYLNPTDKTVCIRYGAFHARELVVIPLQ